MCACLPSEIPSLADRSEQAQTAKAFEQVLCSSYLDVHAQLVMVISHGSHDYRPGTAQLYP